MQSNITNLPIELRIKIFHHLPSPPSLLSAILSTRSLYTAYHESHNSITASVLQNSTSQSSVYCNFLTYGLLVFHRKNYITLDKLHKFVRSYLSFANPGDGCKGNENAIPWEIQPPPDFDTMKGRVHDHIFLWATEFCGSKLRENLKTHTTTKNHIAPTPTKAEIARAARAFYQYFLYTIISQEVFYHCDDVDYMGRPMTGKPDNQVMGAFVEAVEYRDRKIIEGFLKNWMVECVRDVVGRCVGDKKNPVRREPARWWVSILNLERGVDDATQALITRLGPIDLWEFAFGSTYDEQFKVYCQAPAALDDDSFRPWEVLRAERNETKSYDPRMRICKSSIEIGEGGNFEWWDGKEGVMKEGILWDEWRLESMGLQWPKVKTGVEVEWYRKDTIWKGKELAMGDLGTNW